MNAFQSSYVKVVGDTGWTRDDKSSRLDRGYAVFRRIIECAQAPNPSTLNLVQKELMKTKYPGNRDFDIKIEGNKLLVTSIWDNSDD